MNLIQKILYESELDDEDEFDLNPIFQPNPNQLERYKQELERRKKVFEEGFQKIKLGLEEINKAFESNQWESDEEEEFLELFYKSEVKVDFEKYPNYIFIIKDDEVIAYQDLKNKWFRINYYSIWRIFENKFHWDYNETQSFIKIMLNEHFKLRGYTPCWGCSFNWPLLNEHFKLRGYTPVCA